MRTTIFSDLPKLTSTIGPRSREVWRLQALGFSYREIGEMLGMSSQTAKNHLALLRHRTGARSGLQLHILARHRGIITDADEEALLQQLHDRLVTRLLDNGWLPPSSRSEAS